MNFVLILVILASSAHALTRDQMQQAMDGEDLNQVLNKKTKKKVEVTQCSNSAECKFDEVCYKAASSDLHGVCVKKPKD